MQLFEGLAGYRLTRLRQQVDPDSPIEQRIFSWKKKKEVFVKVHPRCFDERDLASNTTFRYKITPYRLQGPKKIYGRQAMTNKFTVCVILLYISKQFMSCKFIIFTTRFVKSDGVCDLKSCFIFCFH